MGHYVKVRRHSMMMPRCRLSLSSPRKVRRGWRSDRHLHRNVVMWMLMVDGRWYQESRGRCTAWLWLNVSVTTATTARISLFEGGLEVEWSESGQYRPRYYDVIWVMSPWLHRWFLAQKQWRLAGEKSVAVTFRPKKVPWESQLVASQCLHNKIFPSNLCSRSLFLLSRKSCNSDWENISSIVPHCSHLSWMTSSDVL